VFRVVRRHAAASREEKAIEREHEGRKEAIDAYFRAMRERAREEEERVKLVKLERIHKDQIRDMMVREVNQVRAITPMFEGSSIGGESSLPFVVTPSAHVESIGGVDTINFDQYRSQAVNENANSYDLVPIRQFEQSIAFQLTPSIGGGLDKYEESMNASIEENIHIEPFDGTVS
jgi:hypothetical protein